METPSSGSKDSPKSTSRIEWWIISGITFVKCPKCAYVAEYLGAKHRCPGCNKESDIELG